MESTGVYHLPLLHFLKSNQLEAYVINPLITNSNKNQDIRKVKNDKKDALSIAQIDKFQDIKAYSFFDIPTFTLKCLCRDYYKPVDSRSVFKKKLSADLYIIFPGYKKIFSDITGPSSIAVLKQYQTPKAVLDASKDDIKNLLINSSKKSLTWCNKAYDKLIKASTRTIGISSPGLSIKLLNSISILKT
uniref:IS110 family transposase n=1 Tax=Clostridium thailandense TaxID=2794346 RepID=UPI0028ADE365|nr:transposase [Clostridium thailandense]